MCDRYVSPTIAEMERYWALSDVQRARLIGGYDRHNIMPPAPVPIIFMGEEESEMCLARWGLVPPRWRQPKLPPSTFNARIEDAATQPIWRQAVKNARCLIPAIGWYEWQPTLTVDTITGEMKVVMNQPYFLHLPGRQVFAFAGLMSRWTAAGSDAAIFTTAIVTRAAEGPAAEIHTRMPLILPKDAEAAWLNRRQTDGETALREARTAAVTNVLHHAAGSRGNHPLRAFAD
ncbi:MAG: SOS response-associated peptidase [Betaproteobacteria bacterium]